MCAHLCICLLLRLYVPRNRCIYLVSLPNSDQQAIECSRETCNSTSHKQLRMLAMKIGIASG